MEAGPGPKAKPGHKDFARRKKEKAIRKLGVGGGFPTKKSGELSKKNGPPDSPVHENGHGRQ